MVLFMLKPHYIGGHGIIVLEPVSFICAHPLSQRDNIYFCIYKYVYLTICF